MFLLDETYRSLLRSIRYQDTISMNYIYLQIRGVVFETAVFIKYILLAKDKTLYQFKVTQGYIYLRNWTKNMKNT